MKLLMASILCLCLASPAFAICEEWRTQIEQKQVEFRLIDRKDDPARIEKLREILDLLKIYIICVGENNGF